VKFKYKIIDNFLDEETFLNIKNVMEGVTFPWYLVKDVNEVHINKKNDLTSYLVHMFFYQVSHSSYFDLLKPILNKMNVKSLIRIKGNVYFNTKKMDTHEPHVDYSFPHQGAIFYINTNNGKTILENNVKIDSVENRLLLFESFKNHSSTNTTDSKFRMNINFNYF